MIYQSKEQITHKTINNFKFLLGIRDLVSVNDDSETSDYILGEYGPKLIW